MTLGELIRDLERAHDRKAGRRIRFAFGYFVPGKLESYRGYHDELSIPFEYAKSVESLVTVEDVLEDCRSAVGKTFTDYGDYTARLDTPVWVAECDTAPGVYPYQIRDDDDVVTILTDV